MHPRHACLTLAALAAALPVGCASPDRAEPLQLREVFPHVRVDARARVVELDGEVPIDAAGSRTFLEVLVCTPGSREHETLVMTPAKPSHVHAALLLAGLASGTPGGWRWDQRRLTPIDPTGDPVRVRFLTTGQNGREQTHDPAAWVRSVETDQLLSESGFATPHFVFAGSFLRPEGRRDVYAADIEGTIVGLATFGHEVVAWRDVFSPEAAVEPPQWIADPARVPPAGTPVRIRLDAAP